MLRIKAMVWMVFPRPISSARITLVFDHQLPFYPIPVSIFVGNETKGWGGENEQKRERIKLTTGKDEAKYLR